MLLWILSALLMLFLLTVVFGAPYVPTRQRDIETALDLLDLKPGEMLLDLGAGDGRLLKAAAQRGWQAVGYEINPILWVVAFFRTWPQRHLAQVHLGSYKRLPWPEEVRALYIFGSKREMQFILRRLSKLSRPLTVVSYGFALPHAKLALSQGPFYVYHLGTLPIDAESSRSTE